MGYYCTVPQCTSHNGKTKNVRFHGFPRDKEMSIRWNLILKRGKEVTKYSKVCSKHFTPEDYNVTAMGKEPGRKKTLNKSAIPTQNLPKLNSDGTVMSIRKRRTVKYNKEGFVKNGKRQKSTKCQMPLNLTPQQGHVSDMTGYGLIHDPNTYRLQTFSAIASTQSPQPIPQPSPIQKPIKQDATIQTDSLSEDDSHYYPDSTDFSGYREFRDDNVPKDYTKDTNFALNSEEEAERYALDRKPNNLPSYEKESFSKIDNAPFALKDSQYQKIDYQKDVFKIPEVYGYPKDYYSNYSDGDMLKQQQHNLQMLHQSKMPENQNFFSETQIKQEVANEEDIYSRAKEQLGYHPAFTHLQYCVKQEPEFVASQSQSSPYYSSEAPVITASYLDAMSRPGPESLMAKQNALAAQPQLWPSAGKRPFFYAEHYSSPIYTEDYPRAHQ